MKYSEYIQAINREFKTKDNVIASMHILPPRSVKDFPLVNFRKLWHLGHVNGHLGFYSFLSM